MNHWKGISRRHVPTWRASRSAPMRRDENTNLISLGLTAALTSYSAARSRMVLRVTAPSSREQLDDLLRRSGGVGLPPNAGHRRSGSALGSSHRRRRGSVHSRGAVGLLQIAAGRQRRARPTLIEGVKFAADSALEAAATVVAADPWIPAFLPKGPSPTSSPSILVIA